LRLSMHPYHPHFRHTDLLILSLRHGALAERAGPKIQVLF
jgi:hypothetical protein